MPSELRRSALAGNIAGSLKNAPRDTQERMLCHFFRAEPYGASIAREVGIEMDSAAPGKAA